jgi:hypothetical protein
MTEQPFTPNIAVEIGAAAAATRAQLDALLDRTGISFGAWIGLATIWNGTAANAGPPDPSDTFRAALEARLVATGREADAVLAELASAGLAHDTGDAPPGVQLTADGEATFRGIRDAIGRLQRYELDGIATTDLETTRRVLRLIATGTHVEADSFAAHCVLLCD